MKKLVSLLAACSTVFACCALCACTGKNHKDTTDSEQLKEVVVYTYDSFAGEWGPGPELSKKFAERTGLTLTFIDCGDAIQVLNRAILEKDAVQADVIVGIDNNSADQAREAGILEAYTPKELDRLVDTSLRHELDDSGLITPYDFGHFAMIYDTQATVPPPHSLEDLTKDIYRKKIILMDPRTSTPGLGFVAWTVSALGSQNIESYWKRLAPNILSMTAGWSEGWGMFLEGEAPLVISYTTSPAYNVEYENTDRYVTLLFDEGHVRQVEGYALLTGAPNPKGAKQFMDFLISGEAQETLPLTQWMYPANASIALPESYHKAAPLPAKTLATDSKASARAVDMVAGILGK